MEENNLLNQCLIVARFYHDTKHKADQYALHMQILKGEAERLLNRLVSDDLITESEVHVTGGKYEPVYLIKSKTMDFIDNQIPSEFTSKPYFYHLQIEKEKADKETIKDEADLKVKQITIANSKIQKRVPIISALIAALSLITTVTVSYLSFKKNDKLYIPVQEIKQLQQTQDQINKSFQQFLDTLSKNR